MTANTTAGSRFATLTLFPQMRFSPTQNISTDPTSDRWNGKVHEVHDVQERDNRQEIPQ